MSNDDLNLDTLPTGLITHYKDCKNFYKPYTQFKMAMSKKEFLCSLITFETTPDSKSCMEIDITEPFNLNIKTFASKEVSVSYMNNDITANCKIQHLQGDDLQGIYWGVIISAPEIDFENDKLELYLFKGNVRKYLSEGEKKHLGSFFTLDEKSGIFKTTEM